MKGPAGVLAIVLAETVAGAAAYVFLMPLWSEVRHGFYKVAGVTILALSVGMWAGAAAARQPGSDAGRWAVWLAAAFTIATAVWLVLLFARQHGVARVLGIATVPLAVGLPAALPGTSGESWPLPLLPP